MWDAQGATCIKQIVLERKQGKQQNKRKVDVLREETYSVSGKKCGLPVSKLGKPGN
jgi:hypothetical protein